MGMPGSTEYTKSIRMHWLNARTICGSCENRGDDDDNDFNDEDGLFVTLTNLRSVVVTLQSE